MCVCVCVCVCVCGSTHRAGASLAPASMGPGWISIRTLTLPWLTFKNVTLTSALPLTVPGTPVTISTNTTPFPVGADISPVVVCVCVCVCVCHHLNKHNTIPCKPMRSLCLLCACVCVCVCAQKHVSVLCHRSPIRMCPCACGLFLRWQKAASQHCFNKNDLVAFTGWL